MAKPSSEARNGLTISLCSAALFALVLAGCASDTLTTADLERCQKLGFRQGTKEYDLCLRQTQRQRADSAEVPEQLRD
ncbi:MAG: hypothetical protein ACREDO_00910 [Methyloceanibacter sp.]